MRRIFPKNGKNLHIISINIIKKINILNTFKKLGTTFKEKNEKFL